MPKTRVAFLGAGLMSRKHGQAVASFPHAEVVGITGRSRPRAAALAGEIGGEAFATFEEMIDQARPDALYYCNSPHKDWWRSDALSGGQFFEQGIHLYEMAMHLLGRPVRIASFLDNLCHRDMPDYEVDDTGSSSIRFDSGAIASITTTNCAVPGLWKLAFTVVCEKLTVFFDGLGKARFVHTGGEKPRTDECEETADSHYLQAVAFIKAVRGEGPAEPTVERGFESLRLVDAALRSSKQGKIIEL